ncbi:hypothetical protein MGYG_06867 [Nannizzia gypsea CBS 118893]|uniref:Uncharacterized protein n=1 Tax=Arthroderma gypseum (strain ATCC MYA-4604 / CBS 118893) TaxID=535722 RepID=E4V1F3_ARTGP|nr:hypothetical protein MGYG_06867 [Nannizzia gypsea CBS 118893]EFR03868.1 hypothetical protein MGYG_06867 [Nannizzia gypsea CBS 118893]
MQITTFVTLALAALASGAALQEKPPADVVTAGQDKAAPNDEHASTFAIKSCKIGANYCGWYLRNDLGWEDPDIAGYGLYKCIEPYKASRIASCVKCVGPVAHCAS